MKTTKREWVLILVLSFLCAGGGALGVAGYDRLKDWVKLGNGVASAKLLEFDTGAGASNTTITVASGGAMATAVGGSTRQTVSSTAITTTVPGLAANGSVSAPTFSFSGDTDNGMYLSAANEVSLAAAGAQVLQANTGGMYGPNGTAAAVGLGFVSDPNTGWYRIGADNAGLSTGGTLRFDVSTTAVTSTLPNLTANGTAAAPAWSFSGDSDTGVYRAGANSLGFATAGTARVFLEGTSIQSVGLGSASEPSYSWDGDEDTGMYREASGLLGFSVGGAVPLYMGGSALYAAFGSEAAPSYSFDSDADTGIYRSGSNTLGLVAGGTRMASLSSAGLVVGSGNTSASAVNIKVFSGSIAASDVVNIAAPSGVIIGVFGQTQITAGSTRAPIEVDTATRTDRIVFTSAVGSTTTSQRLFNRDASNTNSYVVTMFYQ